MTKLLLAALVASMLGLTGLVAFNQYNAPVNAPTPEQVAATDDDSCPGCCQKETTVSEEACPGCPLGEKGGCCKEQQLKSACCGGDAAVKPGASVPKAETKKE